MFPPSTTETKMENHLKSSQNSGKTPTRLTRSNQPKTESTQDANSSNTKSPGKKQEKCKGCNWVGISLRSHLSKNKQCSSLYDLDALEAEAKRLHKEQMAVRNRDRYHNEKDESPRKRAASRQRYNESPQKKKEAMSAYNEKHKSEINNAMRKNYHDDPGKRHLKKIDMKIYHSETRSMVALPENTCEICGQNFCFQKSMKRHVEYSHADEDKCFTCQICDKDFHYNETLERHMKEVHGGEKYQCDKCPAAFTRNTSLEKHQWHHLSYYCNQCKKNIVFKSFGALLQHIIVKGSEIEMEFPKGSKLEGQKFTKKKSGILVTCKTHVDTTQEEEGRYLEYCSKEEKREAYKRRMKRKEEIINIGLKAADGPYKKPNVKVEFVTTHDKKTHCGEEEAIGYCKYCLQKIPFEEDDDGQEREERTLWELVDWW